MDADTLRLILIVVGAALVLALYLWERSRAEEANEDDRFPVGASLNQGQREPSVNPFDIANEDPESDLAATVMELRGRREAAAMASLQAASQRAAAMPQAAVHLFAEASAAADPDPSCRPETLILQLGIRAREGEMRGPEILDAAARCGMRPGELGAFHYKVMANDGALTQPGAHTGDDDAGDEEVEETRTLFSMASMVRPGEFPFDAMEEFRTPGLILFAVLHPGSDNLQVLDDMIAVARRLADEFDAEVLDERRQPLTPIMVDVLRARVRVFDRRPVVGRR